MQADCVLDRHRLALGVIDHGIKVLRTHMYKGPTLAYQTFGLQGWETS